MQVADIFIGVGFQKLLLYFNILFNSTVRRSCHIANIATAAAAITAVAVHPKKRSPNEAV